MHITCILCKDTSTHKLVKYITSHRCHSVSRC